jgi:hypothetical protein
MFIGDTVYSSVNRKFYAMFVGVIVIFIDLNR